METNSEPQSVSEDIAKRYKFGKALHDINDALDKKYGVGEIMWHWFYKSVIMLGQMTAEIWTLKLAEVPSDKAASKVMSLGSASVNFLTLYYVMINFIIDQKRMADGKLEKYDMCFREAMDDNTAWEFKEAKATLNNVTKWIESKGWKFNAYDKTIDETVDAAKIHRKNYFEFRRETDSEVNDEVKREHV